MKVAAKHKTTRLSALRRRTRSLRASSTSAHRALSRPVRKGASTTTLHQLVPSVPAGNGQTTKKPTRLHKQTSHPEHAAAIKNFEMAVRHFQKRNYEKARELFEKLANSAPAEVADRARTHLQFCAQRLGLKAISPRTAGEYHVLGVAELNARRLDEAVDHLRKARKLEPRREDIRYALAAAHALKGERELALEHLKAAIELRPQNRYQARSDRDFEPLAGDPRFQSLVFAGHLSTRLHN